MASNINLDYSSERNMLQQILSGNKHSKKSSQCLIFNIKKTKKLLPSQYVINHHQIFIYVMHSVNQKSLPLGKARQIWVFIKLD